MQFRGRLTKFLFREDQSWLSVIELIRPLVFKGLMFKALFIISPGAHQKMCSRPSGFVSNRFVTLGKISNGNPTQLYRRGAGCSG